MSTIKADVIQSSTGGAPDFDQGLTIGGGFSMIRSWTANGYGSTNTGTRRFTNHTVVGTAITGTGDDAVNGSQYTINEDGIYAISYSENSRVNEYFGISLNANGASDALPVADADLLATSHSVSSGADYPHSCSAVVRLSAGDIIRPHGTNGSTGTARVVFSITQLAKY